MKLSKLNLALLTVLAGSLTACGGDSGSSSDTPESIPVVKTQTITGVAITDDYMADAKVCLDFDVATPCSTDYTAQTNAEGEFSITVEGEDDIEQLAQAVVTVQVPDTATRTLLRSGASTINYQSYLAQGSDDTVNINPFTSQVVDNVILNGGGKTASLESLINNAIDAVKDLNDLSDVDNNALFGDYLNSSDIIAKAEQGMAWKQRAIEIKKQLNANSEYQGWDTVRPIVWNVYQHSYHTGQSFERYEEYIYLAKTVDGVLTEQFEGQQWLVDENSQPDLNAKLQNYKETKVWQGYSLGKGEQTINTFWEFDYNQDGEFGFKGEKISKGEYEIGLDKTTITLMELYNEGNPAIEGGWDLNREYNKDCDLDAEFTKYQNQQTLDACVDMVQKREWKHYLDTELGFVSEDIASEYKKPNNDITQPVDTSFISYYEIREYYTKLDGTQGSNIYKDWDAKSQANLELQQEPYNEVLKSYFTAEGKEFSMQNLPIWPGQSQTNNASASTSNLLSNWNPVSWGSYANGYSFATKQKSGDFALTITPTNQSTAYDANSGRNISLNLPYLVDGEPVKVIEQSQALQENGLKVVTNFYPVTEAKEHYLNTYHMPESPLKVEVEITKDATLSEAQMPTATQTVTVGDSNTLSNAPTFTDGYFSDEQKWNITSSDLPAELMALLFNNGSSFSFVQKTAINNSTFNDALCWDKNVDSVLMDLAYHKAGDIVVTVNCEGNWVNNQSYGVMSEANSPSQYLLRMTEQFTNGTFKAELLGWEYGLNSYQDAPTARYTLEFSQVD